MTLMALSNKDIQYLAQLSKLTINDNEIDEVRSRIGIIIDMVGQLSEVDTQGVEPLANPTDGIQRLRADNVTEVSDNRASLMANAPQSEKDFFLVPKVIE